MADEITEVTTEGWGSRLMGSIKSVAGGFLLFVAAFPVLWVNEGCAVDIAKGLEEGAAAVVSADSSTYTAANNGELVHMTGAAETDQTLRDPVFGVSQQAIQLRRNVEMYQWKEITETKEEKQTGGSVKKTTTYRYEKDWSSTPINSSSFKERTGHYNPPMRYESESWTASNVQFGAYTLSQSLINSISGSEKIIPESAPAGVTQAKVEGDQIYIGASSSSPEIGDMRVTFSYVPTGTVSILAKQKGRSFEAWETTRDTTILRLQRGEATAEEMFAAAQSENTWRTWGVRIGGFILMWAGLAMIFKPLVVLADVLPFLGNLLQFGVNFFAGIFSFFLSFTVIAIAWIFYRPLLGIALLVIAIAVIGAGIYLGMQKKKKKQEAAA